jgi:hypothetical protein
MGCLHDALMAKRKLCDESPHLLIVAGPSCGTHPGFHDTMMTMPHKASAEYRLPFSWME